MHFALYQTSQRLYAVRHTVARDGEEEWRVLKFDRTSPALDVCEDPTPYTKPQIQRLLAAVDAGNRMHGGLQAVCEASAIAGVVQLLEGPYLLLVTKRRCLGAICGHKVYGIDATALLPVLSPAAHRAAFGAQQASTAEQRYRRLLGGVQLTKDFFFSYTWPVHQTTQRTFQQPPAAEWDAGAAAAAFEAKSVWNEFLSRPLREALGNARWVVPLAHGFFQQRPLALLGRTLQLTLVARRSRQFAGTRYLKRGVTDAGCAANDVEVEQVVEAGVDWKSGQPLVAALVQVRGSIPLHWAQQPESSVVKPEIVLHRFDPLYAATRRHFDQLREQYGEPICVLDLVKRLERRPRESVLGREYANAIRFLNQRLAPGQQRVQYTAFDLSHRARTSKTRLLADLQRLQEPVLAATGIFATVAPGCGARRGAPARLQRGALRTNCIDSLDRTNVGQFTMGMLGLGRQLAALGIAESPRLDPASSLARALMDAYEAMGHTLALQYGGSEAHSTFFQRQRGDWEAGVHSRDLLTTVRRFYSNAVTDAEKQDGVNLFLGVFQPAPGRPHLWELGGDSHLHTVRSRIPGLPGRTSSMGSRSSSFSAGQVGMAAVAAGQPDLLSSFPPPERAGGGAAPAAPGSPGSPTPPEAEADAAGSLPESLSTASLVSLGSDGSFAPTLTSLVEGAAQQQPPAPLPGVEEEERAPPSPQPAAPAAGARCDEVAASGSASPPPPPPRLGPRRSPLLGSGSRAAKLESFDQLLSRQPVAHVRLAAPERPAKPSALGWLSPGKSAATAAAERRQPKPVAEKAAAAAAATVAAAGVADAPPGVVIPRGGLQRSNSDPSLGGSLPALPIPDAPDAAGGAAHAGAPLGRRVTFDGGAAGGGGGLLRHSTAPSTALEALAAGGGAPPALGHTSAPPLLVMRPPGDPPGGGGGGGGLRRPASYHTLAGLNLEGAAAAEASMLRGGGTPRAAPPALPPPKPARRLSFPGLARLRSLGRLGSGSSAGAGGLSRDPSGADAALLQPGPSLLGPRPGLAGAGGAGGAPEPLSMSAVVFGAEAVRRGIDTLGVSADPVAAWWLTGADPLPAMFEERQRLHAQIARQREVLSMPLDAVEHRALLEQCAPLMRPCWAFTPSTQGGQPSEAAAPAGQAPAAPPIAQPGLAF